MDIISEILETDRLAEDKIAQAQAESDRILAECADEEARIMDEAKSQAEKLLKERSAESKKSVKGFARKLSESENAKIDSLEKLYEEKHSLWEKDIIDSVIGGR